MNWVGKSCKICWIKSKNLHLIDEGSEDVWKSENSEKVYHKKKTYILKL